MGWDAVRDTACPDAVGDGSVNDGPSAWNPCWQATFGV
jgi:hypothetical protein